MVCSYHFCRRCGRRLRKPKYSPCFAIGDCFKTLKNIWTFKCCMDDYEICECYNNQCYYLKYPSHTQCNCGVCSHPGTKKILYESRVKPVRREVIYEPVKIIDSNTYDSRSDYYYCCDDVNCDKPRMESKVYFQPTCKYETESCKISNRHVTKDDKCSCLLGQSIRETVKRSKLLTTTEEKQNFQKEVEDLIKKQPLHVHTVILPPGMDPDDPALDNAKIIRQKIYKTTEVPQLPRGSYYASIDPSLYSNEEK